MLARFMETQICFPPAGSVEGGLNKGKMASTSSSVWEKAASPDLALKSDNSVPSHMSLTPSELLPQCRSSEQVSPSLSLCVWALLRRTAGTPGALSVTQP